MDFLEGGVPKGGCIAKYARSVFKKCRGSEPLLTNADGHQQHPLQRAWNALAVGGNVGEGVLTGVRCRGRSTPDNVGLARSYPQASVVKVGRLPPT